MNITTKKGLLAGLVGLFAAGGMTQAVAQGGEAATGQSAIDEIIVTANKREQNLIDVPISIVAMTGETIENAGIQNISDLSFAVPNLSVWEVGPGFQTITMRGVGNVYGSSSLVGIYQDETPVSVIPIAQIDLRAVDLARVEVLRGPQGTLYGQGSTSGVVRFITNDPSFDKFEGELGLSVYNTEKGGWSEELTGVFNLPVIDDVLAFRVAASYEDKSGWIDQPAIGAEDINDNELKNVRLKGLWQATEDMTVKATAIHHRNSGGGQNIPNLGSVSDSNFQSAIDSTLFPGFIDDYDIYNITVNYDLGFASLISASSYLEIHKSQINLPQSAIFSFAPSAPIEMLITKRLDDAEVFSQEIRLSDNNDVLDWTLGVFYQDSEQRRQGDFHFGVITPNAPLSNNFIYSKSSAIFSDVSYPITDRVTIGAGTRYFEDDRENLRTDGSRAQETFDKISSKGYLSFALTDESNIYASVSEGFRSGGFNDSFGGSTAPTYDPETLLSYELGVKAALWERRLYIELATFYSEYTDYQSLNFDPSLGSRFFLNIGEAEIKGFEWAVQWAAAEQLSLSFSGNITDGEITKVDREPSEKNVGDPLDFVPEYSYTFTADFEFDWNSSVPGTARLEYARQGKNSTSNRISGLVRDISHSPSIGFLNLHVDARWESFTAELFASNLMDEDRLTTASSWNTGPQRRPRTVGLKLNYDF